MLGNIQINIPIDLGIIQSKNQSSLKNKEDGTKNVESNSIDKIDSITTTSTVIGNKKNVSHSPEVAIVQKHTVPKNNNSDKSDSHDPTIKNLKNNKRDLEDNKNLNLHDMATVQFLDELNFDNGDLDDDEMDYIEEFI